MQRYQLVAVTMNVAHHIRPPPRRHPPRRPQNRIASAEPAIGRGPLNVGIAAASNAARIAGRRTGRFIGAPPHLRNNQLYSVAYQRPDATRATPCPTSTHTIPRQNYFLFPQPC